MLECSRQGYYRHPEDCSRLVFFSYIQGDSKKVGLVLEGYPVKIYKKKLYDDLLYINTHYFHFINQTLSLKLKAHFAAISFQKDVVLYKKGYKKGLYELP